jgi:hypothetical protein
MNETKANVVAFFALGMAFAMPEPERIIYWWWLGFWLLMNLF